MSLPNSLPIKLECIRLRTQFHELHFLTPDFPIYPSESTKKLHNTNQTFFPPLKQLPEEVVVVVEVPKVLLKICFQINQKKPKNTITHQQQNNQNLFSNKPKKKPKIPYLINNKTTKIFGTLKKKIKKKKAKSYLISSTSKQPNQHIQCTKFQTTQPNIK